MSDPAMRAGDTTHECPAPGCETRVPFAQLACRAHWYRISAPTQDRLLREYAEHFGEAEYFEARSACLRELGIPEDEIAVMNARVA
jgi:hypothetical protein